jgi:hypothetical protein
MPIQNYIWSASLDDVNFTISIVDSSIDDTRLALIQKLENIKKARIEYAEIQTKIHTNEQNQYLVDEKITHAQSVGDITAQLELERLYGYIRNGYNILIDIRETLLRHLQIDISGLDDSSIDSFGPDSIIRATVFGRDPYSPMIEKEITLCDYIMTSFPTIRPFERIVISNP